MMEKTNTRKWSGNYQSAEDKALDRFTDVIIDNITNMKNSDWKQPWLSTNLELGIPRNYDGREYNGMNALMLMLYSNDKKFKSPVFITSSKVNSLNFKLQKGKKPVPLLDENGEKLPFVHILKGEKAFPVILHLPYSAKNKDTDQIISVEEYSNLSGKEQKDYHLLVSNRVYSVFNIDQTNLKEARPAEYERVSDRKLKLEKPQGAMFPFPAVDEMIKNNLWICPISTDSQKGCYYSPKNNFIAVPPKEKFFDSDYFYTSLFHEMAHSTGHKSVLNRDGITKGGGMFSDGYGREELVAELTAALVGSRYGLTKHIKDDSSSYLKGWLQALKEEPHFLKTTLGDVKNAAQLINHYIDEISQKIEKGEDLKEEEMLETEKKTKTDSGTELDIQSEDTIVGVDVDGNGTVDTTEVSSVHVPDKKQGANEEKQEVVAARSRFHM
jgi:antirestriction protein ArdC